MLDRDGLCCHLTLVGYALLWLLGMRHGLELLMGLSLLGSLGQRLSDLRLRMGSWNIDWLLVNVLDLLGCLNLMDPGLLLVLHRLGYSMMSSLRCGLRRKLSSLLLIGHSWHLRMEVAHHLLSNFNCRLLTLLTLLASLEHVLRRRLLHHDLRCLLRINCSLPHVIWLVLIRDLRLHSSRCLWLFVMHLTAFTLDELKERRVDAFWGSAFYWVQL